MTKLIFSLISLSLLTQLAQAANTTCFKLSENIQGLPATVCYDTAKLDASLSKIELRYETPYGIRTQIGPVIYVSEKKGDRFRILAKIQQYQKIESVCGEAVTTELMIEAQVTENNKIDNDTVQITGIVLTTRDYCHLHEDEKRIDYKKQ